MVNLTENHAPKTVTDYTTFSSFEFSPAGRSDCTLRAFFIANKQKKTTIHKQQFVLTCVKNPKAAVRGIADEITQQKLECFEIVGNIHEPEWKHHGNYPQRLE